ncbi:MAG TPA: xanthine dehydrogenase family protein molybdopterin-binding subunit, partial [Burkholderiales bacterium]|nr:xanthine dehydrogenase family protein molybdopterin-binding subunit [Burkholderiales bacterium]
MTGGRSGYVGAPLPRANAKRLLAGRGQYVDDIRLARMAHAAFVRSPYAHARIVDIDAEAAARGAGVLRVITGRQVAEMFQPYV